MSSEFIKENIREFKKFAKKLNPQKYDRNLLVLDETCSTIIKELTVFDGSAILQNSIAIFVPVSLYTKYKMPFFFGKLSIADDHIWDYDLQMGDKVMKMKLIWITKIKNDSCVEIPYNLELKKAFSFLQPDFLRYMDKPFWNPDTITQVNLILAFHRTQKKLRKIDIFNICDLINFKMAIDDNRYEYINCEFHKIIDRSLNELIESNKYMVKGQLNFNQYLSDINYFYRLPWEVVDYMVYHFQKSIGSIQYIESYNILTSLSNISNTSLFLKSHYTDAGIMMTVLKTDPSGKCSDVLYELLTKTNVTVELRFKVEGEWFYRGDGLLKEITKSLISSKITVATTSNSFYFIENFLNWLKLSLGKHSGSLDLELKTVGTINPYIFNHFYINHLKFHLVNLNYNLVRMLNMCKYRKITFNLCKIQNFLQNERLDVFGQNVFELLEKLDNVELIDLELNENVLWMLLDYVTTVMTDKVLTQFKFTNNITFTLHDDVNIFEFRSSYVSSVMDKIEIYTESGMQFDFYSDLIELKEENDRFDFYQ